MQQTSRTAHALAPGTHTMVARNTIRARVQRVRSAMVRLFFFVRLRIPSLFALLHTRESDAPACFDVVHRGPHCPVLRDAVSKF